MVYFKFGAYEPSGGTRMERARKFKVAATIQQTRTRAFHKPEKSKYRTTLLGVKTIQRFGHFSHWIRFIGSVPFEWDERRQKFIEEDSPRVHKIFNLISIYQGVNTVYLVLTFIYMMLTDPMVFKSDTIHLAFTMGYLFCFILNFNLYANRLEIIYFLNQFIKVIYLFERAEMQKVVKPTKFEKLLYLFPAAACIQIPLGIAYHWKYPFATYYMVTRLLDESSFYYPLHYISIFLESLMYASQWFKAVFFVIYSYTYFLMISSWVSNVKKEIKKSPKLIHLFRYRVLQLINFHFNESMENYVICGHKLLVIVITVISSYVMIHCYNVKLIVYLSYSIMLIVVLLFQFMAYPLASAVYKNSGSVHKMFLLKKPLYKFSQVFVKSCAPLKIEVGPFYYFCRITPLKFLKSEFTYTMKVHYYIFGATIGHK